MIPPEVQQRLDAGNDFDDRAMAMTYDRSMKDVHDRNGCGYENLEEAFRKMEYKGYAWPEEA